MRAMGRATWAGLGLLAVHAVLLVALLTHCRRPPLRLHLVSPSAPPGTSPGEHEPGTHVRLPPGLVGRVQVRLDGRAMPGHDPGQVVGDAGDPASGLPGIYDLDALTGTLGPGLHRIEWQVGYRGGFTRRVGLTRLAGPFQDPAAPPCAARVLVGQRFLDDGAAGPGTLAGVVAAHIRRKLRGFDRWPVGRFRAVQGMRMRWIGRDDGSAPVSAPAARATGHARATLALRFDGALVDLRIALVPRLTDRGLAVRARVDARTELDSGFYQWVYDLFDGDEKASAVARRAVEDALGEGFGLLPPVDLPGGGSLRFVYCRARPIEVVTDRYAAVWLALAPTPAPAPVPAAPVPAAGPGAAKAMRPVLLGPPAAPARDGDGHTGGADWPLEAPLAVELELDALNGMLHTLWRAGYLDRALARAGLIAGFNEDPLVTRLLSVRIDDLRLSVPPTLWPEPDRMSGQAPAQPPEQPEEPGHGARTPVMRLGVEATLRIRDGDRATPARIFGAAGLAFAGTRRGPGDAPGVEVALDLGGLSLTCEPAPGVIAPCYGDLVQVFTHRASDVHAQLTRRLAAIVDELVLGRHLGTSGVSIGFTVEQARMRAMPAPPTAALRIELFGRL